MSKYGYVGKESDIPQQAFRANAGVLNPNDIIDLSNNNKLTQYGQLELIETKTASNVASTVFTYLGIQFSSDGGSSYDTNNNYKRASVYGGHIGFGDGQSTGQALLPVTSDSATMKKNGHIYIYNAKNSLAYTFITTLHGEDNYPCNFLTGYHEVQQATDAFRLKANNDGNFSFTASLYGIRFA
jgi:hypothetical protein